MLSSLANMFKVADLRNKILFTLAMIALYLLGTNIPGPGVNYQEVKHLLATAANHQSGGGIISFLNLLTGSGLSRMAIFGLGIMPYITATIIIQLLGVVIPKFEEWRDQGAVGQKKLTQASRYLTIALALMQSTGLAFLFHGGGGGLFGSSNVVNFIPHFTPPRVMFLVLTMTAGTAMVMWLSELVTQRGIGQGMSILIFSSVLASIPGYGSQVFTAGPLKFTIFILVAVALLVAIVFVEQGQRRIPVTFAKRVQGRRMYGGQSTYIPMKVNQAGVVPIIFASSVLYFPALLSNIIHFKAFQNFVQNDLLNPVSGVYIVLYGVFILLFAFFYVTIVFDPHQQADIIRKQGGYIPGIRPGPPTERYLAKTLNRITVFGAAFLTVVAIAPSALFFVWHVRGYPYAGTTLLIGVGVLMETLRQIDSQLAMRNYEGFLRQ
jgi:preprotein translocase subunit SecY